MLGFIILFFLSFVFVGYLQHGWKGAVLYGILLIVIYYFFIRSEPAYPVQKKPEE